MARIKKKNISIALIAIVILVIIGTVLISGILNEPSCGNGKCENGETCTLCTQDCGSCQTTTIKTTTTEVTTTQTTKTTIILQCNNNSDCMWCGEDCIPKPNDIPCIAIAPPEGFNCDCVNGTCTKVKTSTTIKMSDSCNDTDDGLKYDIKGTVLGYHLGNFYNYTDFCTGDLLTEYYCLTYYGDRDYNCAYAGKKCVDGACV
jgi:hypothetical protein